MGEEMTDKERIAELEAERAGLAPASGPGPAAAARSRAAGRPPTP